MIIHGYSENELKNLADNSVDMVFTSPPYADRRKNTYGGISEDKYLEWFKPIAIEIKRVLKPTGSFFLNIKPHTIKGERSLYVFELVLMLKRELGFLFVEEYCWTKNAFPGSLKGRFKNAFEPIYHFTKNSPNEITFNPVACGTPIKYESIARTYRKQCGAPKNGSGMTGMNTTNIRNLGLARPSNVVNVNNVSNQFTLKSEHSATFPEKLVEFFVKSFSNEGDLIVDCFAGSGTTGLVCIDTNRKYLLIDKEQSNIDLIFKRVEEKRKEKDLTQKTLFGDGM
jgi:site-specific DNA-methyltransferase (adenine-specific)